MLTTYPGTCHCGAIRFEADLDLTQPTYRCNCSICRRTRFWPAVAREEGFRLLAGQSDLTTPIGRMMGVNLGCLTDVSDETLSRLPITWVDGLHDRWQDAPAFFAHL